ncbi:uncharacterized protein [Atheta coriaria]|uniref:uncharacterized protein n=1 Tax=Dalotia coriaria TaxID=877792 RepID=UPI0031F3EC24
MKSFAILLLALASCNAVELTTNREVLQYFVEELGHYMEENGLDPAHIPIARLGIAPKIKYLTCKNIYVTGMAHDELDVNRVLFRYGARHDRTRNRILLSIPQVAEDISFTCQFSYDFMLKTFRGSVRGTIDSTDFPSILQINIRSGPAVTINIPTPFRFRNINFEIYDADTATTELMNNPLIKLALMPALEVDIRLILQQKGARIVRETIRCMQENLQPQLNALRI